MPIFTLSTFTNLSAPLKLQDGDRTEKERALALEMPAQPSSLSRPLSSVLYDRRLSHKGAGLEIPGPSHSTVESSPDFSKPRYFEIHAANLNQNLTSFHQSNTAVLPPISQTSRYSNQFTGLLPIIWFQKIKIP